MTASALHAIRTDDDGDAIDGRMTTYCGITFRPEVRTPQITGGPRLDQGVGLGVQAVRPMLFGAHRDKWCAHCERKLDQKADAD